MFKNHPISTSCEDKSECSINGTCAINPGITSAQEIIMLYLKELAFYLCKLKDFGITNNGIKNKFIEIFFGIVSNAGYSEEDFNNTLVLLSKYAEQSKHLYNKYCNENDIKTEFPPANFKHLKQYDIAYASIKGEKYFLKRQLNMDAQKRGYYNIILFLCKSFIIKITEMQRLDGNYDEGFYAFARLLNVFIPQSFDAETVKNEINIALDAYYKLSDDIYKLKEKNYGKPEITEVSASSRAGKAVLVSGTDIGKLVKILKAASEKNIDVYTHGFEMLVAHSYPKIKEYKNLAGHFGRGFESCLVDFASFPGAILMTKGSLQCIDYLYKGRLFTLDPIASKGVTKINNDEFDKLVNSALEAKGFKKVTEKQSITVGYNEEEVLNEVDKIFERLINKDIKHLYIVGLLNSFKPTSEYYQEFFKLLPKDCFAISFAYKVKQDNVYHIESLFDYMLLHNILNKFHDKTDLSKLNLSVFLTNPDKQTLLNILYLKKLGIKNIYTDKIPTSILIPSINDILKKEYGIKEISSPQSDLDNTLYE